VPLIPRLELGFLALLSLVLVVAPWLDLSWLVLTHLEAWAAVSFAWSVWLLARNHPAGWFVGLVGVSLYGKLFWDVKLYGEVGLQVFYFVTSLQAIWIWRRQREPQARDSSTASERPVGLVPRSWIALSVVVGVPAFLGLRWLLLDRAGASPTWDALTTVLSVIAHLYLMGRFVESWYLWIAVDTIYVPLYASRELYVTAGLYAVFWVLAVRGLLHFRRLQREGGGAPAMRDPGPEALAG
jgi:nicotinamide mononucleotide transporter